MTQPSPERAMRQGWESEARNWASFARTPGHDRAHEHINLPVLPVLLDLLPAVVARNPDAGRWQRVPMFMHLRAIKAGWLSSSARNQVDVAAGVGHG